MGCGCRSPQGSITNKFNQAVVEIVTIAPTSDNDIMFTITKIDNNKYTISRPLVGTPGVSLVAINFLDPSGAYVSGGIDEISLIKVLKMRLEANEDAQIYLDGLLTILDPELVVEEPE